jgi:hypothetical protein
MDGHACTDELRADLAAHRKETRAGLAKAENAVRAAANAQLTLTGQFQALSDEVTMTAEGTHRRIAGVAESLNGALDEMSRVSRRVSALNVDSRFEGIEDKLEAVGKQVGVGSPKRRLGALSLPTAFTMLGGIVVGAKLLDHLFPLLPQLWRAIVG